MTRPGSIETRASLRVVTGLMSVMLHVGVLLLVLFAGGRHDGADDDDDPAFVEWVNLEAPKARQRSGVDSGALEEIARKLERLVELDIRALRLPTLAMDEPAPVPEPDADADAGFADSLEVEPPEETGRPLPIESVANHVASEPTSVIDSPSAFVMPQPQASELLEHIDRIARKKLKDKPRAKATWQQQGQQYEAVFAVQRAPNGVELDHVVVDVSAEQQGRRLETQILLRRLSYSQFTNVVDYWDPTVQLHDDEIVGRTHINSRFNVLSDREAKPALRGRVSTAAGGVNMVVAGPRLQSDIFREGIQTRAGRISLSEQVDPLDTARLRETNMRVHEFMTDTRIVFLPDGSYWWRGTEASAVGEHEVPAKDQPLYLVAAPGVWLYVQGVVAGQVLVYSPRGIVVEGSLTYAHDPRVEPGCEDFLGLVSDRDVEVASNRVTGPGDLRIEAAIFARRRFVVNDFEHSHPATLRIHGSLAAGTMSATEPRYAMRLVYDERFERRRPPGFPSMNRFVPEAWDRQWTVAMPAQWTGPESVRSSSNIPDR